MKAISYLIPLILSILCLLYLLFYPYQRDTFEYNFTAKVLAKESRHSTITNAISLSSGITHKETLEAYEKYYYYVSNQKSISIKIISNQIQYLKIELLSDTGNSIPCQIQKKKSTLLLTPSSDKIHKTKRIFLCLANRSTSSFTAQIQRMAGKSPVAKSDNPSVSNKKSIIPKPGSQLNPNQKPVTSKPSNQSASNYNSATTKPNNQSASNYNSATTKPNNQSASNDNSATTKPNNQSASNDNSVTTKPNNQSASNDNSVTTKPNNKDRTSYKRAILHPQCLVLPPGISKKLTLKNYTYKNSTKRFTWLSTNPNSVTVKNNTITTHHAGTAIIYLKDNKHPANTSSCFIRILIAK